MTRTRGTDGSFVASVGLTDGDLVEMYRYVALARAWAEPPHPAMVVMHGLSGSGKTTVSDAITAPLGALRVRTDVERKRLRGHATTVAPLCASRRNSLSVNCTP